LIARTQLQIEVSKVADGWHRWAWPPRTRTSRASTSRLRENTPRGRSARDLAGGSREHGLAWLAMVGREPPSWNRLSPTAH